MSALHMQRLGFLSDFTCSFSVSLSLEADLSLHTLSESVCGSLVVYVIPQSSSLLPQVILKLF